ARDAADVEAGAAEGRVLLDAGDAQAELGGPDRGDVPTRAGADDDEIEWLLRHVIARIEARGGGPAERQTSRSRRPGASTRSLMWTRNWTASRPSTRRWSYDSARYMTGRISTWPFTATGRSTTLWSPRMPVCGGFRIGVESIEP